jgi:hypothetical protein
MGNIWVKLVNEIPSLMEAKEIHKLQKGGADEQKFIVVLSDGTRRLLRVASIEKYEMKREQFRVLQAVKTYNVKALTWYHW